MSKSHDPITVRMYGGAWVARWRGARASCTSDPTFAASRVASKVLGHGYFILNERASCDYLDTQFDIEILDRVDRGAEEGEPQ